jgi:hypothetical protein
MARGGLGFVQEAPVDKVRVKDSWEKKIGSLTVDYATEGVVGAGYIHSCECRRGNFSPRLSEINMADILDYLESMFAGQYAAQRVDIKNAKRLSFGHMGQVVSVDLFSTGNVTVGGTDCALKEEIKKHVDGFRQDPNYFKRAAPAQAITPEGAILKEISKELFDFLPEHDRRALLAAYQVILSGIDLVDYSPAVMPVGRVYEGFLGELVVKVGLCTKTILQDPMYNLTSAFDTKEARSLKAKVSTHEAKMDSAKQRLKEFRHIQLHSQSSQFVQYKTREEAVRFAERVLGDMQALFDYFRKYFA